MPLAGAVAAPGAPATPSSALADHDPPAVPDRAGTGRLSQRLASSPGCACGRYLEHRGRGCFIRAGLEADHGSRARSTSDVAVGGPGVAAEVVEASLQLLDLRHADPVQGPRPARRTNQRRPPDPSCSGGRRAGGHSRRRMRIRPPGEHSGTPDHRVRRPRDAARSRGQWNRLPDDLLRDALDVEQHGEAAVPEREAGAGDHRQVEVLGSRRRRPRRASAAPPRPARRAPAARTSLRRQHDRVAPAVSSSASTSGSRAPSGP